MNSKGMSYSKAYNFLKGISPKMNAIAGLEFELTYHNDAVHYVTDYTTWLHPYRTQQMIFNNKFRRGCLLKSVQTLY